MRRDLTHTAESIHAILDAVVSVRAQIPEDALSADLLGTERSGHGVVIREDNLILTIGYLIADAEAVWIGIDEDTLIPAHVIASDYETGFGLLRPSMPMQLPGVELGSGSDLEIGEPVFVVGSGGLADTIEATVTAKQEFAGRWEYLLEEAIYTVPAHSNWAGAALLNGNGRLCGIGSLLLQESGSERPMNMFVPVDILVPVLDDLCRYGRPAHGTRPWFGMLIHEEEGELEVVAVYRDCPADQAGIEPGDMIVGVGNASPADLADFYRRAWAHGTAGVRVPLLLERDGVRHEVTVTTSDRNAFMKKDTIN